MLRWLCHRIGHWTGWNHGTVETAWVDGRLCVYFQCAGCGCISGAEDITARTKTGR